VLLTNYSALYDATLRTISLKKFEGEVITAGTLLASFTKTLLAGDILKLAVVGNRLFVYVNDVRVIGPIFDNSIALGSFGIIGNSNAATAILWSGWAGGRMLAA